MTLGEIKSTMATLPLEQQNHLAAYLVHLRHMRDPQIRHEITALNNERDLSKWITPEQLREKWSD
jgi:hypothetical protein